MKKGKPTPEQLEKDRRKRQVRTYITNNGKKKYSESGKKGRAAPGSGSFTSESARAASLISWEKRRARAEEEARREVEDVS